MTNTLNENTNKIIYSICHHGNDTKMAGICSISTSCKLNTICMERAKDKRSICAHCYAQKLSGFRKTLRDKLEKNYDFYTTVELQPEDVPTLNYRVFRLEAFGDLQNILQFQNYCTIASANKNTMFTLWTKNAHLIRLYIKQGGIIPDNLYIVISSPYVNKPYTIADLQQLDYISFVDAVFTIYDKDFAREHNVNINCMNRCNECMKCYSLKHGEVVFINELMR